MYGSFFSEELAHIWGWWHSIMRTHHMSHLLVYSCLGGRSLNLAPMLESPRASGPPNAQIGPFRNSAAEAQTSGFLNLPDDSNVHAGLWTSVHPSSYSDALPLYPPPENTSVCPSGSEWN